MHLLIFDDNVYFLTTVVLNDFYQGFFSTKVEISSSNMTFNAVYS